MQVHQALHFSQQDASANKNHGGGGEEGDEPGRCPDSKDSQRLLSNEKYMNL